MSKDDCKKAIDFYKNSLEITDKYKYVGLSQDSYKKISECYESLNDYKNALATITLLSGEVKV